MWAKLKAAEEKKKAELRKGDKATREAAKDRQRAETKAQPPRKRQRRAQTSSFRPQGKKLLDESSSESEDLPPDAQVINNAAQAQEADAEHRSFLSWRMQDADGILLLSCAIKHLCARTVRQKGIKVGQEKLIEYLTQTAKVCTYLNLFNSFIYNDMRQLRGAERMRPNHHFSSHLAEQIERYGPMSQIWTYSGERLNYELKNTTSNRRSGGERELTFAKTFHRRRDCVSRVSHYFHCYCFCLTRCIV